MKQLKRRSPDRPFVFDYGRHRLDRCTPKEVSPESALAFVRVCMNRNPYWVRYWGERQEKRFSTGNIDNKGRDRSHDAYAPFWLNTERLLDKRRRVRPPTCLGLWSRSAAGTYRFIAYDIEPRALDPATGSVRAIDAPTVRDENDTYLFARRVFLTWKQIRRTEEVVVGALLVRSSTGRYHVWVVLERPVDEAEHDSLLARARELHGGSLHLDKTTGRGRTGMGDCFRLPWTIKNGEAAEVIQAAMDWQRLRSLAAREPVPPRPRGAWDNWKSARAPAAYAAADLVAEALKRYPVHGPGERNAQQARFILSLANKGLSDEELVAAGERWADEYAERYRADPATVKKNMPRVVRSARKLVGEQRVAGPQWVERAKTLQLSPDDRAWLDRVAPAGSTESWFCEAVLIHSYLEISPEKMNRSKDLLLSLLRRDNNSELCILATNQQLARIIEARHGVCLAPMQLFRLKRKFLTAADKDGACRRASVHELWVERSKGRTGAASEYQVVDEGLLNLLLLAGRRMSEDVCSEAPESPTVALEHGAAALEPSPPLETPPCASPAFAEVTASISTTSRHAEGQVRQEAAHGSPFSPCAPLAAVFHAGVSGRQPACNSLVANLRAIYHA